jgi:hypothetical protein
MSTGDRVAEIGDRLQRAGLIPPVRSVELVGGGWIVICARPPITDELRARVAAAVGQGRWTLRDASGRSVMLRRTANGGVRHGGVGDDDRP